MFKIRKTWKDWEDWKGLNVSLGYQSSSLVPQRRKYFVMFLFLETYLQVVLIWISLACRGYKLVLICFDLIKLKFKLNCKVESLNLIYEGFDIWVLVRYFVLFCWIQPLHEYFSCPFILLYLFSSGYPNKLLSSSSLGKG